MNSIRMKQVSMNRKEPGLSLRCLASIPSLLSVSSLSTLTIRRVVAFPIHQTADSC